MWKAQPDGGLSGLGSSPVRTTRSHRSSGLTRGVAASRARTDLLDHVGSCCAPLLCAELRVDNERFAQDRADLAAQIERTIGVLKDDLNLVAQGCDLRLGRC